MSQDETMAAPGTTTETISTSERLRHQREQLSRRKEEVRRDLERVREARKSSPRAQRPRPLI
jgi:hypothetical protein